nr:protein kinase [Ktedonobacterales bacterium]
VLATRRLSAVEALTYGLHIAAALGFIRTHGVAHGRLTPATVVIRVGTARLADIGLGQIAVAFADPWPGDLAACPSYLPPEAVYEPFPTPAMDVYHFGALLWEMLAGVPPPLAPAPLPILAAPPILTQLIARCLHPTADQRPTEMNEVIATLKAIKRVMEGKGAGDSQVLSSVRAATLTHAAEEQPTLQLPREAVNPPHQPAWDDALGTPWQATATLPQVPPHVARRAPHWAQRLRTVRLGQLSSGKKLGLTGGILALLIVLFAVTNGTLLNITHAAPPTPTDGIVLHAGTTVLAARATPYRVTQTLVVGPGRTLRVTPGTTLLFVPGTALVLAGGALEVHGTAAAPVVFTALADAGASGVSTAAPWGGIQLTTAPDGSPSRALLDGITLRAAGDGQTAAITCHAGMLTLVNSTQSDSLGVGVQTEANCWGEVAHTTFVRDRGAAAIIASASLHFHDNTFTGLTVSLP